MIKITKGKDGEHDTSRSPPIPLCRRNTVWLSYLLIFAAVLFVILVIVKILFKYGTNVTEQFYRSH
jgi:hypothetical protein